jgi:hypothetical protein
VLIVADGFSCREQIAQGTNRRALHLAEVLRMATEQGVPRETFPSGAMCATTPHASYALQRFARP